jgi:hypothetical protein
VAALVATEGSQAIQAEKAAQQLQMQTTECAYQKKGLAAAVAAVALARYP